MKRRGKKYKGIVQKVAFDRAQAQVPRVAVEAVVKTAFAKFDETVGLDISLGIDASKGDQVVRGSVLLPHGTGKKVVVAAFVNSNSEEAAKQAGADFVGSRDLIEKVEAGWMDFDVAVATPDMMIALGKVAKILGPKGLLPNKKNGTVDDNIGLVINEIKKGRLSFKSDKSGGMHVGFGKLSMGVDKLMDNLDALLNSVRAAKPAASRGKFLKKVVVSSTMGLGFQIRVE